MFIFDDPGKMYGDYATKPNLNLYKDAEHKFSATNVVYGFFDSAAHEAELYTDPDCTIPLTLSKAVELIQNGVQIVGCLNNVPCFATGFICDYRQGNVNDTPEFGYAGIVFAYPEFITGSFRMVVGVLDSTNEAANGNFSFGSREGDGYEEGYRGVNVWPGTLAFGMNTAGQKVLPNPFAET